MQNVADRFANRWFQPEDQSLRPAMALNISTGFGKGKDLMSRSSNISSQELHPVSAQRDGCDIFRTH